MSETFNVVRVKRTKTLRKKFSAKLPPTQLYQEEKDIVAKAVADKGFNSYSDFCRTAVRKFLEQIGYEVPDDGNFVRVEES